MRLSLAVALVAVLSLPAAAGATQTARLDVGATLLDQPVGRPWAIDLGVKATIVTPDGAPPSPIKRMVIRFPHATLNDARFPTCDPDFAQREGGARCPKGSKVGSGTALADARPLLANPVVADIGVYNGPRRNGGRVLIFDTLARGVSVHLALVGILRKTSGRFGYSLTMDVPPLPTIPGAPPAAISQFDVQVGARRNARSFLEAPRSCPKGGLPFQGAFSYADGSRSQASTAISCTLRASSATPAAPPEE